jgi:hypothetical protein
MHTQANPLSTIFDVYPFEYADTAMITLLNFGRRVPKSHRREFFERIARDLARLGCRGKYDIRSAAEHAMAELRVEENSRGQTTSLAS